MPLSDRSSPRRWVSERAASSSRRNPLQPHERRVFRAIRRKKARMSREIIGPMACKAALALFAERSA
jgi:hypothetical protein